MAEQDEYSVSPDLVPGKTELELTPGNIHEVIKQLAFDGVSTEPETLHELLGGFLEGEEWVLQRFGWEKRALTAIKPFEEERKAATARYLPSQKRIEINAYKLQAEQGFSPQEQLTIFYAPLPDMLRPHMTGRQFYEGSGVEEMIHYLQDNHAEGLGSVPPPEQIIRGDLITYRSQPHELEALKYVGIFFQEKYGNNPYEHMEASLRGKTVKASR